MDELQTDWQAWYDRHGPGLLLFARQFTTTLAEAEDAMHDGFIRFWKRRETVDDPTAYLYRAVRSAAMDQRRGSGRRQRREQSLAHEDRSDTQPWQQAVSDETDQQLRESIEQLPEQQREVLVLKIWGGLTFDQIADATDSPRSTTAARYSAALKALRETMQIEEPTQ